MASNNVIVVSPKFCAPNSVDLAVIRKAKDLTDGNFTITDVNGNITFKIKEKLLSFRNRRVILDAAGNPLLSLREKMMSLHRRWKVFRGDKDDTKHLIFTVKQPSIIQSSTNLDVFLASNTSQDVCDFKVKGSWSKRSCTISIGDSDTIISQLDKKNTVMSEVPADAFMVKVHPNIDHAFIIALIPIIDSIYGISISTKSVKEALDSTLELGSILSSN